MKYDDFIKLKKEGKIYAVVNKSMVLKLVNLLPKRYRFAHLFWSWIWMLSIPAFILVAIFYKWWVGLLLLFIVTPIISKSVKKSAAQFLLEYAEEDKKFFKLLLEHDALIFKETEGDIK